MLPAYPTCIALILLVLYKLIGRSYYIYLLKNTEFLNSTYWNLLDYSLNLSYPHQLGTNSLSLTVFLVSISSRISISPLFLSNCIIYSRQAPQGEPTQPSGITATTLSIRLSPFVIILAMAFLSAHIPSVHAVSMHTPT